MAELNHDISQLAAAVLTAAKAKGLKISCAESCTGGLVSAALTAITGSSAVVERGFVTYSNEAKQQMLGVRAQTLQDFGAVSLETAQEMAEGALRNSLADLSVSITGIAGPGGSDFKPEGRVCFGLAQNNQPTQLILKDFGALGRDNVRQMALKQALTLLLNAAELDS